MMAIFIDPRMSGMTVDVIEGKVSQSQFRKAIVWLVGSRLAGTCWRRPCWRRRPS